MPAVSPAVQHVAFGFTDGHTQLTQGTSVWRAEQRAALALAVIRHTVQHLADDGLISKAALRLRCAHRRQDDARTRLQPAASRDRQRLSRRTTRQRPQIPVPGRSLRARVLCVRQPKVGRPSGLHEQGRKQAS